MQDVEQLPPHDIAAEAGALGCVLQASPGEAEQLLAQLRLDHFYDDRHRLIFQTLTAAVANGKQATPAELYQRLRDLGRVEDAGGLEYFGALPEKAIGPSAFDTYLATIDDRSTRRATLRDAAELAEVARDTSITSTAIAAAARRMAEAYSAQAAGDGLTVRSPDELLAMTFDDGDRILGDRLLASGQSLVIAGAGSIGKSRLALQLAVSTIAGRTFLGFETRQPDLRWLILQAENSNRRLFSDLDALRRWAGPDWPQVNARLALHTLETDADGFLSLDNEGTQRRIAATIAQQKPDVVVWDSLYNFGAGDLNSDEDMSRTLLAVSRLTKTGNANRCPVVLHHAITGKTGAARATGFDRSSFGRNSKVLHSWTRAQINLAPGTADNNEVLVVSCGKCSNGREFAPMAIRLNADTLIFESAPDFDMQEWQGQVTGAAPNRRHITANDVRELTEPSQKRIDLVKAVMAETGCGKTAAYDAIEKAERAKVIFYSKATRTYSKTR